MQYLIVKCTCLNDQWECDADRKPICITENYSYYDEFGYEIYEIDKEGNLKRIRDWEEPTPTKSKKYKKNLRKKMKNS